MDIHCGFLLLLVSSINPDYALSGVFANQKCRRCARKEANTMKPAKDDTVLSDLSAMRLCALRR